MADILELRYSATNTYLIRGKRGSLLLDTGWAGTFPLFCRALGACGARLQEISYILITHFHPDHMGIAQELAAHGPQIAVLDLQLPYIHAADSILSRDSGNRFLPIIEERVRVITPETSRAFLRELGLDGEILPTPGHSEDSLSLWLDEGIVFVGDLNPLYELDLHRGTRIWESWQMLLSKNPKTVYYGHAKTARLGGEKPANAGKDIGVLVRKIMKYTEKGVPVEGICRKLGAERTFAEDVVRIYLTHPGVSLQGILDRLEIKGK